ncbi:MAG TPA: malate synthase A [Thermoplasmata archaeon]|nr:malate synthase A [Thermoplasmata archaeon]
MIWVEAPHGLFEGRLVERPAASAIQVGGPAGERDDELFSREALEFLADLHRGFNATRFDLLNRRAERQTRINRGATLDFLPETQSVRDGSWRIAPVPADLQDRRVEITGPTDRKMMINALNSGAKGFMADFEDANVPTWRNVVDGQWNLIAAVGGRIEYTSPEGKTYRLGSKAATLLVRPRGWHLPEKHVRIDGEPASGSLVDFGLFFFHNAKELVTRGSGPYLYLPKMESHLEARLWNDVFDASEEALGVRHGSTKATVLIETLPAAFEMEEILFELKDHAAGLNAGRWDYIFSAIKTFRSRKDVVLPDRAQITMTVPFMQAYTNLLVRTCHRRGAHAIGGMAAFVPNRRDPEVTAAALAKVREDKVREAGDGFDGTWVAHPDLVPIAMEVFDRVLGPAPNQTARLRDDVVVTAGELLDFQIPNGTITEAGLRSNVSVAIQYIESWLRGTGAVAIANLMEDTATAEIARSQVWQWMRRGAHMRGGRRITRDFLQAVVKEELSTIRGSVGEAPYSQGRFEEAVALFNKVSLVGPFVEFLTLPAYEATE